MPQISAKRRSEIGRHAHAIRGRGFLPAVLYGPGVEPLPLSVSAREFNRALAEAGETSLITLKVEGGNVHEVLIHDVAHDPLTSSPIHADFYAVPLDRPIDAEVPLVFSGQSPAVANEGGIIVKVRHELSVRALPKNLPHELAVDLARLEKVGDKIHVSDVVLPAGVETRHLGPEEVLALVEPPRSEAELAELVEPTEAVAPAAEVKTEREVKAEAKGEAEAESEDAGPAPAK